MGTDGSSQRYLDALKDDIANAVVSGIEDAEVEFRHLCGEPLKLAPEYLVTVNVARKIRAASDSFKVDLERAVDAALKGAGSSKPGTRATSERRDGRFDILVTEHERRLCIVEIKNPTCWQKTIHDMERLRATLLHATWGSSICLGVIAFPLHCTPRMRSDAKSLLEAALEHARNKVFVDGEYFSFHTTSFMGKAGRHTNASTNEHYSCAVGLVVEIRCANTK